MTYLCAVKNRDIVEIVDLAEKVLSAFDCDTFLLGIGRVVKCNSNLVHFLRAELDGGIKISDVWRHIEHRIYFRVYVPEFQTTFPRSPDQSDQ